MSSDAIRESIQKAMTYLGEHPAEARYTDSSATATLERGLRIKVGGPGGEQISTDMPTSVGGTASAPSPGWLFRAAIASCEATLIAMRAAVQGIELSRLEVVVDSESDDRGILGIDEGVPAGPLGMRIRVRLGASGASEAALRQIAAWGHQHCPVSDAVTRAIDMSLEVEAVSAR
jgi:uncharacterized OsmC-like protein